MLMASWALGVTATMSARRARGLTTRTGFGTPVTPGGGRFFCGVLAGLNAQSKGQRLGIFKPTPKALKEVREQKRGEEFRVDLLGRALPAMTTEEGMRAVIKSKPVEPEGVERYLESKFGDVLLEVRKAMTELANALKPNELAQRGFGLYEQFRPVIPEGVQGWGAKGELDLGHISKLAAMPK